MSDSWPTLLPVTHGVCVRLLMTLLHFAWQGLLLGGLAYAATWFLRDSKPTTRYLLHLGVLLCMPISLIGTWAYLGDGMNTAALPADGSATVAIDGSGDANAVLGTSPSRSQNAAASSNPPTPVEVTESPTKTASRRPRLISRAAIPAACIYLAGAGYFLIRFVVALWGGHRLCHQSQPIREDVLIQLIANQAHLVGLQLVPVVAYCERVAVPTVMGVLRPVVLLPSMMMGIETSHLAVILSHEFAHIRRGDLFVNMSQRIIEAMLFYHPAVWYVSHRVSYERELCCDDLAVAAVGRRMEYAGALLDMAELCSRSEAGSVSLAATGDDKSALEKRIYRLISGAEPHPRFRLNRSGIVVLMLSLAVLAATPGIYQGFSRAATIETEQNADASTKEATASLETTVSTEPAIRPELKVDVHCLHEGKQVKGAEVYLFQYQRQGERGWYTMSKMQATNEKGVAQFSSAVFSDSTGHFDRWVYARLPGKLVGVARSARFKGRKVFNPKLMVTMVPSRSVRGTVTVPEGFDPKHVLVKIRSLHISKGGSWDYESFPRDKAFVGLHNALPEIFEKQPNERGEIEFEDVPVKGNLYLVTRAKGLAEAQWMNRSENRTFDQPIDLKLEREARLVGVVRSPDGAPVEGAQVSARISDRERVSYMSTFETKTNLEGEFELTGLGPMRYTVRTADPKKRWVFRPLESIKLESDEVETLELQMEQGVDVTGIVKDEQGNPVEAAHLSALVDSDESPGVAAASSDSDGRFKFRLPLGLTKLYFNGLPDGFEYPRPQIVKKLAVVESDEPLELEFVLKRKPK